MKIINSVCVIMSIVALASCSSFSAHDRFANTEHLKGNISSGSEGSFPEYHEAIKSNQTASGIAINSKLYLNKGVALSRSTCFDYLDRLAARENNKSFSQNELGVLVVLATGIMGINAASQDSFTRLALGAAAANSTFDLYSNHYLMGPDSDAIVDMIKTAMDTAEAEIKNRSPVTFVDAYTLLESYSRLCSDTSVRRLVRESIKAASFKATDPIINEVARSTIDQIAKQFERSGLSDHQLFGLYWLTTEDPDDEEYTAIINEALGDLKSDAESASLSKKVVIKNLFLRVRSLSSVYQKLISEAKLALEAAQKNKDDVNALETAMKSTFVTLSPTFASDFNTPALANPEVKSNIVETTLKNIPFTSSVLAPEGGLHISVY